MKLTIPEPLKKVFIPKGAIDIQVTASDLSLIYNTLNSVHIKDVQILDRIKILKKKIAEYQKVKYWK